MKKRIIIFITIAVIIFSIYIFIQYKKLENSPIQIKDFKINIKNTSIDGLVVFDLENQSNLSFKINSFDLSLFINEVKATQLISDNELSFNSGEKTTITIPYNTNLKSFKGFDLANFMIKLIEKTSVSIKIRGNIKVTKGFINKSIPIDFTIKDYKKN